MKARNVVSTLIVLLATGCTIYFFSVGTRVSDDSEPRRSAQTPVNTTKASSEVAGKREEQAKPTIAVETTRSMTLFDRFAKSTNLLELITQLHAAADAGDADAARMIAEAFDECFPYSITKIRPDEAYIVRQFDEPERSIALVHLRVQDQRCGDLIATGRVTVPEARRTDKRATELRDLFGQAMELATELSYRSRDPKAPKRMTAANVELARRIALSNDPHAIAALGFSDMASRPTDGYAWMLVACDLGHDCGASGIMMRRLCLQAGQCISGDFREFLRRRQFSLDQYQDLIARESELLQAIRSGDVSKIIP